MKKIRNWLCTLLTLLLLIACPAAAYGEDTGGNDEDKTLSPYFYVQSGEETVDSFPLKETDVSTNINGVIAETYVTQTYANQGKNPINASYVFPASTRVTVHGMKMVIGDQVITARIKEKEEAKEEFTEAKKEGKSASLLEEQRPNVFTMNVANIMPGDTVRIELHYTELIVSTEGVYQFVFPTVVGPRYSGLSDDQGGDEGSWVETPYIKDGKTPPGTYNIAVNLSTGVPITGLSSSSHKVNVEKDGESAARVTLADTSDYAGNRDFILDYRLTGGEVSCGLMLDKTEDENFFMLMVQPPERYKPEDVPPRDYIFVLDVSGSMYGYPLDTAKELITNLVGGLKETDTFNVMMFSGGSNLMFPVSVPATEQNIKHAISFIDNEDGGGGTELAPALKKAIAIPRERTASRSVVIITDGYIYGEKEIFEIISGNLDTASFFSFGIGDSVNRYLIDGMAKAGQGESFVVTGSEDALDTAARFRTYIEAPILTDIRVEYEGFDTYDVEPPVLPTLFAQRPIVLFGKWRGEPAGTIRITGKAGKEDYSQEIRVSEVAPLETNAAIRYLWARTKVERLTDYGAGENDDQIAVKREVTDLGLRYSMLTPYTSFIAVLETVRNQDGESTDVKQPSPLPLHVSNLAVGGYTLGSEPGDLILAVMVAAVPAMGVAYSRRRKKTAAERGGTNDLE